MPAQTRATARALLTGKSGPITPKAAKTKGTTAGSGAGVQKRKPGWRRRLSPDVDDDAEPSHRDASTQTSSLALARSGRSLRRNAGTQTSSSVGPSMATQTRPRGTAAATLRTRRRAGWVLRALETFWSGVLLNAAFFHFNPGNSAAEFCLRQQQLYEGTQPPVETPLAQPARPRLAATDQCIPHYCPGTFTWHEIPLEPKYYKGLGLKPNATYSEIRSACNKAKKRWHPDHSTRHGLEKDEANKIIYVVNEACGVLQYDEAKDAYDEYGPERPQRNTFGYRNRFTDSRY